MAGRNRQLVIAFVLAYQTIAGLAATPKICQQLTQYSLSHGSHVCEAVKSLQELGCLCGMAGQDDFVSKVQPCFSQKVTEDVLCTAPLPLPELAKKHAMPYGKGALSMPGIGMVQLESLSNLTPASDAHTVSAQAAAKDNQSQVESSRPVLDLSAFPEGVPVHLDLGDSSVGEVLVTQSVDANGELGMNIDIGIPRSFINDGGELSLDIDNVAEDTEIMIDSDSSIDVTVSLESHYPLDFEVEVEPADFQFAAFGVESASGHVSIDVLSDHDGIFATSQHPSPVDVVVELDIEICGDSQIHDAIITLRDENVEHPMSGQEIESLFTEISRWLWESLPSKEEETVQAKGPRVQGTLRGVSKLLADVGEQIAELMPEKSLYSGQTLEIIAEDYADLSEGEPMEKRPCAMSALADAARSIISARKAEEKAFGEASCRVCAFINEHLTVLWALVILGLSYVAYSLLASLYSYYTTTTEPLPTLPESSLKDPLILYAVDYAEGYQILPNSDWEPYCGPIKSQEANQQ